MITEREFQATVIEVFEIAGYRVFHATDSRKEIITGNGSRLVGDSRAAGYPDLTIAGNGQVIWAELKSQRGRLEPKQVEWLDALPMHQGYVWRPDELDLVMRTAEFGHPRGWPACWTCQREEILNRTKMKRKKDEKRGAISGLGTA